jgi:hypothetical protein
MYSHLKYTLVLFSLIILSCGPDDDDNNLEPVEEISPFDFQLNPDCQAYETYEVSGSAGGDIPTRFVKFNDLLVFGGVHAIRVDRGFDGATIASYSETQLQVNGLLEINNKVLVCTYLGLFEVAATGAISRINEKTCFDLEFDGERLYTATTGDDTIEDDNPSKINVFTVDLETYEYEIYNNPAYTDIYLYMYELEKLRDEVYVLGTIDNEVTLVEFRDGVLQRFYDKTNDDGFMQINTYIPVGNSKLFTVADQLLFFTDNGPNKSLLLKRQNEEGFQRIGHWHIDGEITNELYREFMGAHDNVFRVDGNLLYVNSSKGLFKFTFDNDFNYTYELMVDDNFSSNNWIDFSTEGGSIDLVLLNHQSLLRNTCGN